jgi:hypothetical protein
MTDASHLLRAYDSQLRDLAEIPSTESVERHGPLLWARFAGPHGFVTYRSLDGYAGERLDTLIAETVEHYAADPAVTRVEWKTRGHDSVPELHDRLVAHGFERQDTESVMIGEARLLAVGVELPPGVTLRRVASRADVEAVGRLYEEVFGEAFTDMTESLVERLASRSDDVELWVAEADGKPVSAGRLEVVKGTEFAGLWGGGTVTEWRGKGIYRALTAARARSALERGARYLQSDSTEYSRPILERSGLVKVTTTTPYLWSRRVAQA